MTIPLLLPVRILHDISALHESQTNDCNSSSTPASLQDALLLSNSDLHKVTRPTQKHQPHYICATATDSDSDSTSDSEPETPQSISRPASSCGYYDDTDSDTDLDLDRCPLPSCFPIASKNPNLQIIIHNEDFPHYAQDHVPGTPGVIRESFDWECNTPTRPATIHPVDDDDDDEPDDIDQDDWPDEMDSDDFPILHTWSHSWIWDPAREYECPPQGVPAIRFDPVESLPPDQLLWTPIQDHLFGLRLTVPDHMAFNVRHPPMTSEPHEMDNGSAPVSYPVNCDLPSRYIASLGHHVLSIPSLREQAAEGIYSTPITKRRRRSRSRSLSLAPPPLLGDDLDVFAA